MEQAYAIGHTNDTDGDNTLISTTLSTPITILTGTLTSGGTSQWAMKLATPTSPIPTYPITIQNSFDSFQSVPDDYMLVAKRTAATDAGTNAEGSTLTTTYQAYISSTQTAGTYAGKVKYVMVHPNDGDALVKDNQVAVNFLGSFTSGATRNRLVYQGSCEEEYAYVGNVYQEVMTSNISTYNTITWNNDYTMSESYDPGDVYWDNEEYLDSGNFALSRDRHYHVGNYYNWTAAVAMNDTTGKIL